MPKILSVGTHNPPCEIHQQLAYAKARDHFEEGFPDVGRLLKLFQNTEIETRYFSVPLEWFTVDHSFRDRNDTYIRLATEFGDRCDSRVSGKRGVSGQRRALRTYRRDLFCFDDGALDAQHRGADHEPAAVWAAYETHPDLGPRLRGGRGGTGAGAGILPGISPRNGAGGEPRTVQFDVSAEGSFEEQSCGGVALCRRRGVHAGGGGRGGGEGSVHARRRCRKCAIIRPRCCPIPKR